MLQLSPEDQRILEIARDLPRRLSISTFNPDWVSWHDYAPERNLLGPVMVPYDGCVFDDNTIVLPQETRDKLDPDDWGPLIASELVYRKKYQSKLYRGLLFRLAIPTLAYILVPILLWQYGLLDLRGTTTIHGAPVPVAFAFFFVYAGTVLIFLLLLYVFLGSRYAKELRLAADQQVVLVLGRELCLTALGKISQSFPGLVKGKRPDSRYPLDRPSVRSRLERIQALDAMQS